MPGPSKKELLADCEALLDLLEDVLEECEEHGCLHSAALNERIDEWLGPADGEEDVIEITPN